MSAGLKLNLGCGSKLLPDFVNVDKYGDPDLHWDLEVFPWPWEDNSASHILLSHVLEHLGQDVDVYIGIIKELYRVSEPDASIRIVVPHPRHDDFMIDPTHVRAITPDGLRMFSQKLNQIWLDMGAANTPLGIYHGVDLEVTQVRHTLEEPWLGQMQAGELTEQEVFQLARQMNNVIKQMAIEVKVIKPGRALQ